MQVNLHDAKTNLSRYVEQALDGEELVIARAGKALVRLVPVDEAPRRRELGFLQGFAVLDCDLKAELLHWLAIAPERLPATLRGTLMDRRLPMLYSVVSLWEVALKTSLGKPGFVVDAAQLGDGLKQQGHQVIWMGDGGSGG
jgi:prevent-host-death family protein